MNSHTLQEIAFIRLIIKTSYIGHSTTTYSDWLTCHLSKDRNRIWDKIKNLTHYKERLKMLKTIFIKKKQPTLDIEFFRKEKSILKCV